ncbi:MAG: T9SS type A sorting domain-containing protein [Bacteroidetes bacterium]|nr:MAG: T9SS type A sorting domain-containing protein [Bacteroidota bacterium]
MKKLINSFIALFVCSTILGQYGPIGAPDYLYKDWPEHLRSNIPISLIYKNYNDLMGETDSTFWHEQKKAERWMRYRLPKYHITGGTNYDLTPFENSLKGIYNSSLVCGQNDPSNWISNGPVNIIDDSTKYPNGRHFGGRVDGVYNHPQKSNVFLCGSYTSGIFRSTDSGLHWYSVTDNLNFPILGIKQIVSPPDKPDTILAITGYEKEYIGNGLIISYDAGETWQEVNQQWTKINWLCFHPSIPGLVFAAGWQELLYSTDYGLHWESAGLPNDFPPGNNIMHRILVLEDRLFMISDDLYAPNCSFFKASIDVNSASISVAWAPNNINNIIGQPTTSPGSIFFSNQVDGRFVVQVRSGQNKRTYITKDSGDSFENISNGYPAPKNPIPVDENLDKNQIVVSATNPDIFYLGNLPLERWNINNKTWEVLRGDKNRPGVHDDYRAAQLILTQDGKERLIYGNDGGIVIVENGLDPEPKVISLNGNLSISMIHNFDYYPKLERVVYGFQDNDVRYSDVNTGISRIISSLGETEAIMIQKHYPSSYIGQAGPTGKPIIDNVSTLNPLIAGGSFAVDGVALTGRFKTYRKYPEKFIVGLNNGRVGLCRKALENTQKIVQIGVPNIDPYYKAKGIHAVAICEKFPAFIYASEANLDFPFRLYRSKDDGSNWEAMTPKFKFAPNESEYDLNFLLTDFILKSISVDHIDSNLIYCGLGGVYSQNGEVINERFRVIKSSDGGENFIDYSQGLPGLPIDFLLTVDSDQQLVFCATSVGIYYRDNTMSQWECFSKNLPKVEITALKFDYCTNTLMASTYGRGFWKTPVPFATGTSFQENITENTTWDEPRQIANDIVVKTGNTLTIKSFVLFEKDRKITVEPGAKLNLEGATLTNYCDDFWAGIVVQGNSNLPQNQNNQGFVQMNNTTIENAKEALRFWEPNNYASTGGYVFATNSKFINNWRSAEFIYYHDFSTSDPGVEIKNRSFFTNCEFAWDNSYLGENSIAPAVTMYHVNGVQFNACHFEDQRISVIQNPVLGTSGIGSLDASFVVQGTLKNPTLNQIPSDWYDEGKYNVSTFKNLRIGVEASNATSLAQPKIDQSHFANNHHGLIITSVDNLLASRNKFELNWRGGILMDNCTAYHVEGNEFVGAGLKDQRTGVLTINSGTEDNQIYRNHLRHLHVGNVAQGVNGNDESEEILLSSGLEWNCNRNEGGRIDFMVTIDDLNPEFGEGVRPFQGSGDQVAANVFSQNLTPGAQSGDFHISSTDNNILTYFSSNKPDEIPELVSGLVLTIQTNNVRKCDSKLGSEKGNPGFVDSLGLGGLVTEIKVVTDEIKLRNKLLHIQLQLGDQTELHDLVSSLNKTNRLEIKNALMSASPFLSEKLLRELGEHPSSVFPHAWYKDVVLANNEVARNNGFMAFLKNKPEALPEGLYLEIMNKRSQLTERGRMELEILNLKTQKENLSNRLLSHEMAHPDHIDWLSYENRLKDRDHVLLQMEETDFQLGRSNKDEATQRLNALEASAQNMNSLWNQRSTEDYVLVKNYVMSLLNDQGAIRTLTESEIADLEYMATHFVGRGAKQARNILCFFEGRCETVSLNLPTTKAQQAQDKNLSVEAITEQPSTVKIVPNPNQGQFEIKTPEYCELKSLKLYNTSGQEVPYAINHQGNLHTVKLENPRKGIYLIEVSCSDQQSYRERLLIIE